MRLMILALALASSSFAGVILTMDEVGFQTINGLAVTKGGVTFNFTDTSGADYDSTNGPGIVTYIQDPSIEGSSISELVSVTFSQSFNVVQFGLALNAGSVGSQLATVNLYNGAALVLTTTFGASLVDPFPEAEFRYSGAAVNKITIAPNSTTASAFALDNLFVNTPEPSTFSMLAGAGLMLAAGIFKRRKNA
jgi:hypothetical protein